MNLKEVLRGKFSEEEMKNVVSSFDIIGSIAIIDVPEEMKNREKEIADAIMSINKNVKTVCRRAGEHAGEFRVRPVEVIGGEQTTETYYLENGARMHLDVNRVYFTPRLSFERTRIANQVKKDEVIGAWFAGVGPFPLVIFKKQPNVSIYAVELNPVAYDYLVENVRINKAQSVITPVFGDVREVVKTLPKCDRIIMPLPKGAETFLDVAFDCVKSGGVVHFYSFGPMEEPFDVVEKKIFEIAKTCNRDVKIVGRRVVRPYSPSVVQVSFDVLTL